MLRFEPESSCLCCTIFVTILWFSVRKRKETAENSSPQTTPQSRMATLFFKKKSICCWFQQRPDPLPPQNPRPLGATQIDKDFQQKHGFASSGEGSLCAVDSKSRLSGSLLQRLSLSPMSLLVTLCFPWCSSPCPFLIFFLFLAYHSFAFFLEVYRGNRRRLEQNKNHLHLSQALRYLSQLW